MGAWSTTIMGGDTPLDIEGTIYDLLGMEQFPEGEEPNTTQIIAPLLEEQQMFLLDKLSDKDEYDWAEGQQLLVLGWMMCTGGAKIHPTVKDAIIKACDQDEWAQSDDERAKHVAQLKEAVIANDGTSIATFTEEGLFQKLAEHLGKGNTGPINL